MPPHPSLCPVQVQTITMPATPGNISGTYRGACTFYGSSTSDIPFGTSADRTKLVIGCYDVPIDMTTYTATWRTGVLIDSSGTVDATSTFSMGASEYFRAVTADSQGFYTGGSAGIKYVPFGAQRAAATVISVSGTVRQMGFGADGSLLAAVATTP